MTASHEIVIAALFVLAGAFPVATLWAVLASGVPVFLAIGGALTAGSFWLGIVFLTGGIQ